MHSDHISEITKSACAHRDSRYQISYKQVVLASVSPSIISWGALPTQCVIGVCCMTQIVTSECGMAIRIAYLREMRPGAVLLDLRCDSPLQRLLQSSGLGNGNELLEVLEC
jgi:hypothetical protein